MDKETDALLKIARERENKKDLLAYQKLKEISTGRTYSEAQDILDRMGTKEVVLLPEAVHISDGETGLTVKHEEKPRKAITK